MDKRAKKRIQALRDKIAKLRQRVAGAKAQEDEPGELKGLLKEIADCEAQIKVLSG